MQMLARLEARIKDGEYYEAQQMYKAAYHRCKARNHPDDGFILLKGYLEQKIEASTSALQEVLDLLTGFKSHAAADVSCEESVLELRRCVGAAAKWCKQCGDRQSLRKLFSTAGSTIMAMQGWQGLGIATQYYCLSDDMASFARGISLTMGEGQPEEAPFFMARAVLQTLAVSRKETIVTQLDCARDLWSKLPHGDGTPVEHYIEFLLIALGKHSQQLFDLLFTKYAHTLKQDDFLLSLVDRIGSVYFGREEPKGGLGGMLGNLLSALDDSSS